jgi:hypothetical protein
MNKLKLSIPINPYIGGPEFEKVVGPLIERLSDHIDDFYGTIRISPFDNDAMGGMFEGEEKILNDLLFYYMKKYKKPVTAVFNNINISPSLENMELFIENFKPYYYAGIKRAIIPFKHWMYTGRIQEEFPDLYIKNTILNNDYSAQDIYDSAKTGYDFIYVDRDVMRDAETIAEYSIVKECIKKEFNKDVKLSLLVNEDCIGLCPVRAEHYTFNNLKTKEDKAYFTNKLASFTCPKWKKNDEKYLLKVGDVIPIRSEWDRYAKSFDVFKIHGRDNYYKLVDGLTMAVKYFYTDDNILHQGIFDKYNEALDINKKVDMNNYIEHIKTCKFQCWKCDICK